MDEYTADPYQTEVEANRVLKKMQVDKAKEEVSKIAEEARARRADENTYKRLGQPVSRGGGGAGLGDVGIKGIGKKSKVDYAKGGKVSSASKRADGIAQRGKTKGKMV